MHAVAYVRSATLARQRCERRVELKTLKTMPASIARHVLCSRLGPADERTFMFGDNGRLFMFDNQFLWIWDGKELNNFDFPVMGEKTAPIPTDATRFLQYYREGSSVYWYTAGMERPTCEVDAMPYDGRSLLVVWPMTKQLWQPSSVTFARLPPFFSVIALPLVPPGKKKERESATVTKYL